MTTPQQPGAGSGQAGPVYCYRHPSRETYVSCTRCGKYACPECLRSASVGQQCVDCVREGQHGARKAAGVFGGRPSRRATVTWTLMAINVIVFLVEVARPALLYQWAMLGEAALTPAGIQSGVAGGQWYRLLTSAFTSPGTTFSGWGLADIAFNMWALYIVGPELERVLGKLRYIGVYLISAVGGGVLFYVLQPQQLAAGASGAIFGLFGAWFVIARRLRVDSRGIVTLIAINLALSFIVPNIAWQDHIGGLVVGAALTAAYAYAPRSSRELVQAGATLAVLVILAVAVIIRTGQLT